MLPKKLLMLIGGFIFLHVGYIGCCNCDLQNNSLYFKINSLTIRASDTAFRSIDTGSPISTDSIFLFQSSIYECVAKAINPFSSFVNSAYAFSCKCLNCGELGLKSKITNIKVSSSQNYSGIAANESLNQFFKVTDKNNYLYNNISVDSMKSVINNTQLMLGTLTILTATKPNNPTPFKLKVTYTFDDGRLVTDETKDIIWQ